MQANQNQKLSLKDKIVSHLPGHKNQDNNMNGVPDRLEKNAAAPRTLSDLNGNGIPDRMERGNSFGTAAPLASGTMAPGLMSTTTTSYSSDLNRNGIPDSMERSQLGQGFGYQSGMLGQQGFGQSGLQGGLNDRNMNGIPDNMEQQGSFGQSGFTDFNRNGIPDQLEASQGFGFVGSIPSIQSSVVDVREAPVIVETIEKPAVVHEVYKTEEVIQIQPIIEREREQFDVYEVVQPMREREVIATEVREAVLPAQTRAAIVEDNSAFLAQRSAPSDFSTREVATTRSQTIENAPIVHETIIHKVIEEVQPVIYKEIDRPILIKETLPIYEKIVEAPHAHKTVLPMRDLGVRSVTTTTSTAFTDFNRDGIPDQLQGGMYQTTGLQSGLQSQGAFIGQPGLSGQQLQSGFSQDLNRNGIPDQFERQGSFGSTDLNRNGVPDQLEGQGSWGQGLAQPGLTNFNDLNRNGVPDSMERSQLGQGFGSQYGMLGQQQGFGQSGLQGGLNDRNMNGIPDNMEGRTGARTLSDLNGNGVPDRVEKMHGLKDLNGNGIDDSLERRMANTSLNANTRI